MHRHAAAASYLSSRLRRRSLDAMHAAGGAPVALDVASLPSQLEQLALTSIHAVRLGVVVSGEEEDAKVLLPCLRRLSVDGHFCVADDTLEVLVAGGVNGGGGEGGEGADASPNPHCRRRASLEHLALTLVGRQPLTARGLQRALAGGGGASLRSLLVHDYRDGALAMDQRCVAAGARVAVGGGGAVAGSGAVAVVGPTAAAAITTTPTLTTTTLASALPRLRALRLSTPDVVHAALVPSCYSGYGRLRRLDLVGSQEQAAASLSALLPLCCMRPRHGVQQVQQAQQQQQQAALLAAQAQQQAQQAQAQAQQQQQLPAAVAVPAA